MMLHKARTIITSLICIQILLSIIAFHRQIILNYGSQRLMRSRILTFQLSSIGSIDNDNNHNIQYFLDDKSKLNLPSTAFEPWNKKKYPCYKKDNNNGKSKIIVKAVSF